MSLTYYMLYNLISGLREMQQNKFQRISENFHVGFYQFVHLNGKSSADFPRTISELITTLYDPAREWGIQDVGEFFPLEEPLLDREIGISFAADEFLAVMKNPMEFEQHTMKEILTYCREYELQESYVKIRSFLSDPANSVISMKNYYQFKSQLKDKNLIEKFQKCYEEITHLNNFRICPHCKWTLEQRNGKWVCNDGGTCHLQSEFMMFRPFKQSNEQFLRMKKGIHRYTLLPGIAEHQIAKRLTKQGYSISMYPKIDAADILVKRDRKVLVLDVKDHYSPFYFAKHIENDMKDEDLKTIWFIIPQARLDVFPDYIDQAINYCDKEINVLSENELYRKVDDLLI